MTVAIAVLLALTGAGSADWRLRMDRFGPVRPGMTTEELRVALAGSVVEDPESANEGCWYYHGQGDLAGVSFMILDGRVARTEISSARFTTLSGARVGSTERELRALYGARLETEPHAYLGAEGNYLTLRSGDRRSGIRFETEHGHVTLFYAGTWESIQYVEGCS